MHLVALVPAGVDVMDVLKHVSADIDELHANPILVWLAKRTDISPGRLVKVQPVLSFLKGDTPQRAYCTSTAGPTGKRFCHGCTATVLTSYDRLILAQQRRSLSQMRRVKSMIEGCETANEITQLRKATGYTPDALKVKINKACLCNC